MAEYGDRLIEHAARYWSAEEENAARRHRDRQANLTVLLAFFGAGIGTAANYLPNLSGWAFYVAAGFFLLAIGSLLIAFYVLMRHRTKEEHEVEFKIDGEPDSFSIETPAASASWQLQLPDDVVKGEADESEVNRQGFLQTYAAAVKLGDLNEQVRTRIFLATNWLIVALLAGVIGIAICVWHQRPAGNSDGRDFRNAADQRATIEATEQVQQAE